ncbi:hypothetical protein HDU78_005951 [Chytriomyces hyalinus]|nr:hypothetical protein HDU78_005951 [Chytriomyces hyalinus]
MVDVYFLEAVGSSVELKKSFWHLNQFDARGAVIVPGLIDTHLNLVEHGQSILNANLRNAKSVKECLSRLVRHLNGNADIEVAAQSGESRKWLLGFGWDHSIWTDGSGKFPTKRDLDSHPRLKNIPIALFNSDNTAVWCNAAALSLTSITRHTEPLLKGGEIIVDDASGEPTGVLVGPAAQMLIRNALSQRFSQDRENAILSAMKAVLAKGITAVYDVGSTLEDVQLYQRANYPFGYVRHNSAIQCSVSTCDSLPPANEIIKTANDYLSAESVHLTLDGGLSTWSSLLHEPYSDDPDSTGHSFISGADLEAVLLKALGKGYHASLQCEGDAAVSQALNVLEQVSKLHSNWTNRIRLSGMSCFRNEDADRLASLGVSASVQPALSLNRKQKEMRLGSGRVKAVEQAWKRMSEKRVRVTFGGGGDAMSIIHAATANDAGEMEGVSPTWTRQQVLDGMTGNAAMSPDKMGRIEKGYFADFGMYKQDWVRDEEKGGVIGDMELVGMEAVATVVGGVVRHGQLKFTR